MSSRSAIVLVIDGLSANMLGPYGNSLFHTDHFCKLSGQSWLGEWVFADSPNLLSSYASLLCGRPKYETNPDTAEHIGTKLAAEGIETKLLTNESQLAGCDFITSGFDSVAELPTLDSDQCAPEPAETELAQFFATAIEQAVLTQPQQLTWIHSRGLFGPWDAPYEMRKQFADESDPDPPDFLFPPSRRYSPDEFDPDTLLGLQQACAAQLVLIDEFVGILLEHLSQLPRNQQPLLILTSPRGIPLGGGGWVGPSTESLFDDSLHVPLLIRSPDHKEALSRSQNLLHLGSVSQALWDWMMHEDATANDDFSLINPANRGFLYSVAGKSYSIRTNAWKFLQEAKDKQFLFAKPDDRWDSNDVANKCPLIVDEFMEIGRDVQSQIATDGTIASISIENVSSR